METGGTNLVFATQKSSHRCIGFWSYHEEKAHFIHMAVKIYKKFYNGVSCVKLVYFLYIGESVI